MPLSITARVPDDQQHSSDVTALLFRDNKLYSASEDGKVKVWTPELKLISESQLHESVIYHIAAIQNTLYTCSNDGTIQAWDITSFQHKKTLLQYDEEVWRFYVSDNVLYAGDVKGWVRIYKNDALVKPYDLSEEIRDIAVVGDLLYTVRDKDVVIHEMLPGEKSKVVTRKTIEGSSPMTVVGNKLCFVSRSARNIVIHDSSKESGFKELGQIEAHELIIMALCSGGNEFLYSGGYDKMVKKWDVNTLKNVGTCEVDGCVSALAAGNDGQVYCAGSGCYIVRIDDK